MKKIVFFLLCCSGLFAGSVRLFNDSPYKLRVVVRGSDGTYLGEMVILPENFNTWSDSYPSFGPGGSSRSMNPERSQTPYMVHWMCLDGEEFGVSINVPSGGAAIAESSTGVRYCKPPPKKRATPYGPQPNEDALHYQNQAPEDEGSVSESADQ